MKVTPEKNERAGELWSLPLFTPLYWNRLEKHGRTKEEFHNVIEWFTGFNESQLQTPYC